MTATPSEAKTTRSVEQRVGADHQVDGARGQTLVDRRPLGGRGSAGEQGHAQRALPRQRARIGHGQAVDQSADLDGVLFGQDLGGGHQRALVTALDPDQQRGHGHHRLARSDVALEQAVHGQGPGQVLLQLGHGPGLGPGEREREAGA